MRTAVRPIPTRWPGLTARARRTWFPPAAVFALAFGIFLASPVLQLSDSYYSMLLSESLLRRGSFALDDYFAGPLDSGRYPGLEGRELPYHVEVAHDHLYYAFPPGSSILSVPFVAVANLVGVSAVASDGGFHKHGERRIQKVLAALLMAAFAALLYALARQLLSVRWSLVVSLVAAFGSPVWSTASRALWSHTWALVLVGVVVYRLLKHATDRTALAPALLATLLAWATFTRPTSAISLGVVGAYLMLHERRSGLRFGIALGLWLGLFVAYSWHHFGTVLPAYFQPRRLGSDTFFLAAAANLVSPARGLLVFVPQLLVVAYLLARYRAYVRQGALVALCLTAIVLHWLVVSSFPHWWGGYAYGPRLMTDTIPWLALLTVIALRAWLDGREAGPVDGEAADAGGRRALLPLGLALSGALVAFGIAANAGGALTKRGKYWYQYPQSVRDDPSRLWDWSDPQVLAWARPRPKVLVRESRDATQPD